MEEMIVISEQMAALSTLLLSPLGFFPENIVSKKIILVEVRQIPLVKC